jgi:hypothetical protein
LTNFFSKNVAKIGQNWPKLTDFQTFCGYFHVFQAVEHIRDILRTNTVKNETFFRGPIFNLIFSESIAAPR